jgi:hypothetical protein
MIGVARMFASAVIGAVVSQAAHQPLPDLQPGEFARQIRNAVQLDAQIQKNFTYLEQRREVKISKLGKVTIEPPRTFQVLPDPAPGQTYKRLIAENGVPLSAEELKRRDAEHQKDIALTQERLRRETPSERSDRLERVASDQRQRDQILEDAFRVYQARIEGRVAVDGQPVLIARLTPRREPDVSTREGRWMKQFEGQIWVAEADYQVVKIDMRATSDVTIGWGVVGRIHKGSRVLYVRRRFENAWLPAETTYEASGRTLIFRPFQFKVSTTYSDYKRRDKTMND